MILLVRHGETFWNRERRIQGHTESALTPLGERQAAAMARLVADLVRREPGDWSLVCSPIGRARQTADAVAEATGLEPDVDHRLSEIFCGEWEGHLWADISLRYPEAALPAWPDEARSTRLVFLVRDLPREIVDQAFACFCPAQPACAA